MQPTNLVVVPVHGMNQNPAYAVPVDVCGDCGGLFARPGVMSGGMPHVH